MIEYRKGNLFSQYESPCVIVHGANAQGVMGSGFAKQFKTEFPEAYYDYISHKNYALGEIISTTYGNDLIVVSAITQTYYGRDKDTVYVNYEAVYTALSNVAFFADYKPIYMPFIGGGLANGDRKLLSKIFEEVFETANAYIYTLD